jgi:hypothetical protein
MRSTREILRIFSKLRDPFGELPTQGERDAIRSLRKAKAKVKTLQLALTAGERVDEELEKAKMQAQEFFVEIWESPDNWYLQRYRPTTAWVWRISQVFTSSVWFGVLPPLLLFLLWLVQQRLLRWHARRLIKIAVAIEVVIVLFIGLSLFRLFLLPLP